MKTSVTLCMQHTIIYTSTVSFSSLGRLHYRHTEVIYVASSCVHNINGKFSNRRQVYEDFGSESSQIGTLFFLFLNLIDVMTDVCITNS